jgi:hypothetical protein
MNFVFRPFRIQAPSGLDFEPVYFGVDPRPVRIKSPFLLDFRGDCGTQNPTICRKKIMFHPHAHLLAFWQLLVRPWLLQDDSIFHVV